MSETSSAVVQPTTITREHMRSMLDRSPNAAGMLIYVAALQGIISNPAFFGPVFQQSPGAADDFALDVCIAALGVRP